MVILIGVLFCVKFCFLISRVGVFGVMFSWVVCLVLRLIVCRCCSVFYG